MILLTEEDARKKWCPFARVAIPFAKGADRNHKEWFSAVAGNRGPLSPEVVTFTDGTPSNPASARCIASECMGWRVVKERVSRDPNDPPDGPDWIKDGDPYPSELPLTDSDMDQNWTREGGYCGLVGAP